MLFPNVSAVCMFKNKHDVECLEYQRFLHVWEECPDVSYNLEWAYVWAPYYSYSHFVHRDIGLSDFVHRPEFS
jgi:hypothetical protein